MEDSTASVRNDWWHVIAFMPVAMIVGGLIGGAIGGILIIATALVYPIALRKDSQWVSGTGSEWKPNANLYTAIGIVVVLSFGLLSYIVSPVYVYRRYKHVPT